MDWVKSTPRWPKYIVHGATVITEQGDGKSFCCNLPNQCCDSHTARLAAVSAHTAELKFSSPRVFVGIDVCNDGPEEAAITIRPPEQ